MAQQSQFSCLRLLPVLPLVCLILAGRPAIVICFFPVFLCPVSSGFTLLSCLTCSAPALWGSSPSIVLSVDLVLSIYHALSHLGFACRTSDQLRSHDRFETSQWVLSGETRRLLVLLARAMNVPPLLPSRRMEHPAMIPCPPGTEPLGIQRRLREASIAILQHIIHGCDIPA